MAAQDAGLIVRRGGYYLAHNISMQSGKSREVLRINLLYVPFLLCAEMLLDPMNNLQRQILSNRLFCRTRTDETNR
jgi:hypothetical protein